MITFALCMADTYTVERVSKDGTVYYPKTILNFLQTRSILGCPELSCARETARQFPTRAMAEKYKKKIGRSYFRVMKIAVDRLQED
jgi:hypothetical protein